VSGGFGPSRAVDGGVNAVVHWPQNLNPGGFSWWHFGQSSESVAVHCPQNFIPPGFSKPHFAQRMSRRIPRSADSPLSHTSLIVVQCRSRRTRKGDLRVCQIRRKACHSKMLLALIAK
jgi:hypothetical protein